MASANSESRSRSKNGRVRNADPLMRGESPAPDGAGAGAGDDVVINVAPFDIPSPLYVIKEAARITSPDLSLVFLAIFISLAYFHEAYSAQTGIVITAWLLLQLAAYALHPDFRNDIFWNLMGMLGSLLIYIAIGHAWTYVKLYLDIWRGHFPKETIEGMKLCFSAEGANGCVSAILFDLKWYLGQTMIIWPVSLAYTITRDPLRIITDLIFDLSRRRYISVITSALDAFSTAEGSGSDYGSAGGSTTWDVTIQLLTWVGYIVGYFAIGYLLSMVKLFLDVWQSTLTPSAEAKLKAAQQSGLAESYVSFIR